MLWTKGFFGFLLIGGSMGVAQAAQCNLVFSQCPSALNNTTINVPEDVIWLDPKVPFCTEQVQVQTGGTAKPPSIMFVIDNSGSMSSEESSGTPSDPNEARFTKVKELLDVISSKSPDAEVGMSIFTRRLQFDHRDNDLFKTAFPDDTTQHDSYVPLMALNKKFADGRTALDTLKALLAYTGEGNLTYATKRPSQRVNNGQAATNMRNGTDITLGFLGAKVALRDAKAEKSNQFIIFLSDGAPTGVDPSRQNTINDFIEGKDVPATFTIFFNPDGSGNVPNTIRQMTDNIKVNGYSATNPRSNYWAINTPDNQLSDLLKNNVLGQVFNAPATPKSATVSNGGAPIANTGKDSKNFIFPDPVALSPTQTSVDLKFTYTYTDSGKTKELVTTYTFKINRVKGAALPSGVTTDCKDAVDIALFHDGQKINLVTADHDSVDIRLTLPNGEVCNNCTVQVQPSKTSDRETVTLAPAGSYSTGVLRREVSTNPAPGDGKLQHVITDSIVIIYVNPNNPLDVTRKAFPYSDVRTTLKVTPINQWSVTDGSTPADGKGWVVLVGPKPVTLDNPDCCRTGDALSPEDTSKYNRIRFTASRSFKVEIKVFSNLGQFVSSVSFGVSQAEFDHLQVVPGSKDHWLDLAWNGLTSDGSHAGTGAYIFKTTMTLNAVPGISEDKVERTYFRRMGVIHGK